MKINNLLKICLGIALITITAILAFNFSSPTAGLSSAAYIWDVPFTGSSDSYMGGDGNSYTFPTNISSFTNDSGYMTMGASRTAISLTTTGSGAATYNNSSGVMNVPTYSTIAYDGTTARANAFPIFLSGSVTTGSAVVNLTSDGTSTGSALCLNGVIQNSVQAVVNDASGLYPMAWAFSNANKTLTVTTNKASATGVISLLGINLLGAPVAAANGSVVKVTVWCY